MAEKHRSEVKPNFKTGKRPTEEHFFDLIDSAVNKLDDRANLTEAADETNNEKFITPKTAKRAVETHLPNATTTEAGIVRRSTSTEVDNGANVNAYVTPLNTKNAIEDLAPGLAPVQSINNQVGDVVLELGEDSGWQSLLLQNNVINYGGTYQVARYRKKNGVVYIEGLLKGGIGNDVTIGTLPIGFRPNKRIVLFTQRLAGVARVDIKSNGEIICYSYNSTMTSISGISFII